MRIQHTLAAIILTIGFAQAAPAPSRSFRIRYIAQVNNIPVGTKKLRLWVPLPQSNSRQTISHLTFEGSPKPQITTEPKYNNKIAYYEIANPPRELKVGMTFDATRMENRGTTTPGGNGLYLQPNKLVPLNDEIRLKATKLAAGKSSIREKCRAFYNHILNEMTYDKSGKGWGRGDFRYACDIKRGNCTDFHAYFIGLCRNADIPARFEIGLSVPAKAGKTGGYHCWAYFRDGKTWIPVDISEADKHPEKADYFFGTHCVNRVAFSRGRDIVLAPKQAGEPLNFFIYPYAEADGKTIQTEKTSTLEANQK